MNADPVLKTACEILEELFILSIMEGTKCTREEAIKRKQDADDDYKRRKMEESLAETWP